MGNHKPTQCDRVLRYMREFGSITQADAIRELGCMRLASRISELRKRGIPIQKETRSGKNRWNETTWYAAYSLEVTNT